MVTTIKVLLKFFLGIKGNVVKIQFDIDAKNFTLNIPDDQYWISIKDILLNREYEYISGFSAENFKGLVVDAGANTGIYSLICSRFAKKVVALEPYPENYQRLLENVEKNSAQNILPLNKALWYKKDALKIFEGSHSGEHSIFSTSKRCIQAPVTTLDELVRTYGKIDLLKIDIEGSEFSVFENLGSDVLNQINAIVGEIHLEHGAKSSIVDKLEAGGFRVYAFNPPLCAKKDMYRLRTYGMIRLRLLRRLLYTLVPFKAKANSKLIIFFASKNH